MYGFYLSTCRFVDPEIKLSVTLWQGNISSNNLEVLKEI